jgi:hypothetical protein
MEGMLASTLTYVIIIVYIVLDHFTVFPDVCLSKGVGKESVSLPKEMLMVSVVEVAETGRKLQKLIKHVLNKHGERLPEPLDVYATPLIEISGRCYSFSLRDRVVHSKVDRSYTLRVSRGENVVTIRLEGYGDFGFLEIAVNDHPFFKVKAGPEGIPVETAYVVRRKVEELGHELQAWLDAQVRPTYEEQLAIMAAI